MRIADITYSMDGSGRIRDNTPPPMLSTVLLTAITVVLCVIIAAGVVAMAEQADEAKIIGLQVSPGEGGSLSLTVHTGQDISGLVLLEVLDAEAATGSYRPVVNQTGAVPSSYMVGETYTVAGIVPAGMPLPYNTRILVRGTFSDEYQVVLLDERVTFTSSSLPGPTYQKVEHISLRV